MLIAMAGSTSAGLVLGWLMGILAGRGVHRPLLDGLVLSAATLLFAIEVFVLVDWRASTLLLGATGLALWLHLEWRCELYDRFGPSR